MNLEDDRRLQAANWFAHAEQVIAGVARAWPGAPRELIHDAFIDALLEVCEKNAYDANQGALVPFLIGATKPKVKDRMRSEGSRLLREEEYERQSVADRQSAAREGIDILLDREQSDLARQRAELIRKYAARTDEERRLLELWEQGVKDVNQLAAAIGHKFTPPTEREAAVRRMQKRIAKRLERYRDRLPGEEPGS